jgi:hypothetical protein
LLMNSLFRLDALRHEVRILGPILFMIPIAVAVAMAAFTVMMFAGHVAHTFIGNMLIGSLEALLPLVVGILLARTAIQDASLELLLTVRTPYRYVVLRRCTLILVWTMFVEIGATVALYVFLPWAPREPFLQGQLTWLSPLLWFAAIGIMGALLLRSQVNCVALFASVWLIELSFHSYFTKSNWLQPWFLPATLFASKAPFWLTNRIELLITALVLSIAAWFYLHHPEWRFRSEEDKS